MHRTGIDRLGIYVPGGTAAYPSSVLMSAIPARVAGVGEIIMVTPPTSHLNNAVLLQNSSDRQGVAIGVQAVGADLRSRIHPRVDKIVGPGNAYVMRQNGLHMVRSILTWLRVF